MRTLHNHDLKMVSQSGDGAGRGEALMRRANCFDQLRFFTSQFAFAARKALQESLAERGFPVEKQPANLPATGAQTDAQLDWARIAEKVFAVAIVRDP
jgi:hypothetical protein